MVDLNDFGVKDSGSNYEDDGYEVYYPKDIEPGDIIEGEIFLSEVKPWESPEGETQMKMSVIITSHEEEEKWIYTFWNPKLYTDDVPTGMLYAKKGGKLYLFIDSLLSSMFKDVVRDESKYHSVDFVKFRESINNKILSVTAQAIKPTHFNAKAPNIIVTNVELSS